MTDFIDELMNRALAFNENDGGATPEALERFRRLLSGHRQMTPEETEGAFTYRFACLRVGYTDCDDYDAKVVLGLIDSVESILGLVKNDPNLMVTVSVNDILDKYAAALIPVLDSVCDMSMVRATALGRKLPLVSDFMPKVSATESNVTSITPDWPSGPPIGNAG